MPSNEERRETAQRRLEEQLEERAQKDRQRRIFTVVGALVAIAAAAAGSPNSVAPRVTSVVPPVPLPTGYLASGGMLPDQLGAINKTTIPAVAPVCDGRCSPAAANIAVAMQAQAQAAGSLAAPGDSFAESFHEIPWRSNSGTNRAAKPRNITSYTEVLEEVNFINVLNLFIVP